MTESNTNGSTRNVIDAFVSAQENKRVAQDGATQNVAAQSEPSQNVATPSKAAQPAVPDKKPGQKRKNIWKILVPVLAVAVVGVVIAVIICVLPMNDGDMVSLPNKMDGYDGPITASTAASLLSQKIAKKLESDSDYSYEDAVKNYEKVYNDVDEDSKIYVLIKYAEFVYSKTNDLDSAIKILERLETSLTGGAALQAYCWKLEDWYYLRGGEKGAGYSDICANTDEREGEDVGIPIEFIGGSQEDDDE